MRFRSVSVFAAILCCAAVGATNQMTLAQAPSGAAPKYTSAAAKAEADLNGTKISIDYHTPGMHDRKIFGGLVPYDKVWRTGANEATTLTTSGALEIGDLKVPAGRTRFILCRLRVAGS